MISQHPLRDKKQKNKKQNWNENKLLAKQKILPNAVGKVMGSDMDDGGQQDRSWGLFQMN